MKFGEFDYFRPHISLRLCERQKFVMLVLPQRDPPAFSGGVYFFSFHFTNIVFMERGNVNVLAGLKWVVTTLVQGRMEWQKNSRFAPSPTVRCTQREIFMMTNE